jgi:hypothetical protein
VAEIPPAPAPAGFARPDDDPWPEPDDLTPSSDEPPRSRWDGLGVGGTTVRAHWETDEDDDTEAVRVVVEAPPPPPPPRKSANGTTAAADAPPAPAEPADTGSPSFDFAELQQRWPTIRDELWPSTIDRATFHSCELVGVEGTRLVVQMSSGNLRLLKDEKKRAIRGDLIRLLGKGADIRFVDDKTPYTPPATAASATAAAAPAAPPLPTNDPVIQAGLRFFGGPLERLPDD